MQTLNARIREMLGGTYCALSDGVTHYRLSGPTAGPAVVLVHGGTVPLWIWDGLADGLAAAGFCVLRYDQFGRGYSEITAAMIADVRRFIPRLHFKPVADAGHGIVLEKPDLVKEMALGFLQEPPGAKTDAPG